MSFSVTVSSQTTLNYQWFFNGGSIAGANSSSYTIASVVASNYGIYCVAITNAGGSVISSNATLTLIVPPGITNQPASQVVAVGQTASFSVNASNSASVNYQWRLNGTQLSGATNSTLAIANVQTNQAGNYTVSLVNSAGSVTSSVAILTVRSTPGILTFNFPNTAIPAAGGGVANPGVSISGRELLVGDKVIFDGIIIPTGALNADAWASVNVGGAGYGNFLGATLGVMGRAGSGVYASQLITNGVSAPNLTTGTGCPTNRIRIELYTSATGSTTNMGWKVQIDQNLSGTFQSAVTGTNLTFTNNVLPLTFGSSDNAYIAIQNPQSPVSVFSGPNLLNPIVSSGATNLVRVSVEGWSPAFQWLKNGSNIPGATQATYSIAAATTLNNGDGYSVIVSNLLNSANVVTSSVATLTVTGPPAIGTQPQNLRVIQGQNISFSVAAGGLALGYQWQATNIASGGFTNLANGGQISGVNSNILNISMATTNNAPFYRAIVSNVYGAVTSAPASLIVLPNTVLVDGDISSGTTQTGSAVLGSTGDVWNAITSANGNLLSSAGSVLGGVGITMNTFAQLYIAANGTPTDPGTTNLMEDYTFGYNTSGYTPTITASITGLGPYTNSAFILVVYAAGNSAGQGGNLSLTGAMGGNSASILITTAASRQISAGAGVAYATFTGILTNGTLTFTSTENAGQLFTCVNGFQLEFNPPPVITSQPNSQTNTVGGTVSFNVTAIGSPSLSYQWNFNGASIFGATNASLTLNNVVSTNAGNYTVVVTNSAGSITSTVAALTVYLPPSIASQPQNQTLAIGQPATFAVVAAGTAILCYQWQTNGGLGYDNVGNSGIFSGANSNVLTINGPAENDALSYRVIVTNNIGSVTSAPALLTLTNPVITLSMSSGQITASTGCSFQISVPVGITYIILASTDLQNWIPIATNVATTGSEVYTDYYATNYTRRFYRTVLP